MRRDLETKLIIKYRDDASRGLNQTAASVRRFGSAGDRTFGNMRAQIRRLGAETNQLNSGFSTLAKLAATIASLSVVRETFRTSLDFERGILEMKQNAGMTVPQAAEMRQKALEASLPNLQLPSDILQGEKAYARAGMKFEQIRASIEEASRAATVMRATVEDIANMDFDIQDKFKVAPERMSAAHNMLYYHGNAGRFEAKSMAALAPVYLNAMQAVGIGGERGLNFVGALTQSIMKQAPATEPSQVATLIQQGLSHITSAHYVKGLKKFGIDVTKYAPKGQFYGEGGVEGMLDLARAMKKKGLTDPFKLAKAGFADQESVKFWRQLMQDADTIGAEMKAGEEAARNDAIGRDLDEMKQSNFGKIKAAQIAAEKAELSEPAQKAVTKTAEGVSKATEFAEQHGDKAAAVADTAVEHPGTAAAMLAAGFFGGKWLLKKALPQLGLAALRWGLGQAPMLGMLGGQSLSTLPMFGAGALTATTAAALTSAGAGFGAGYGLNRAFQDTPIMDWIDSAIAKPISDALDAVLSKEVNVAVTVDVKGGNIVAEVNKVNSREARRF